MPLVLTFPVPPAMSFPFEEGSAPTMPPVLMALLGMPPALGLMLIFVTTFGAALLEMAPRAPSAPRASTFTGGGAFGIGCLDRKSTRLNSSHLGISYAVFCL